MGLAGKWDFVGDLLHFPAILYTTFEKEIRSTSFVRKKLLFNLKEEKNFLKGVFKALSMY